MGRQFENPLRFPILSVNRCLNTGHSWVICLHSFNLSVWVEFVERSLREKVLKANLSYTRHFFRNISFVEEFEGEFFICSYDVSR